MERILWNQLLGTGYLFWLPPLALMAVVDSNSTNQDLFSVELSARCRIVNGGQAFLTVRRETLETTICTKERIRLTRSEGIRMSIIGLTFVHAATGSELDAELEQSDDRRQVIQASSTMILCRRLPSNLNITHSRLREGNSSRGQTLQQALSPEIL